MGEPAQHLPQRSTSSSSRPQRSSEMATPESSAESQVVDFLSRFNDDTDSDGCLFGFERLPLRSQEIDELMRPRSEFDVFLSQRGEVTLAEIASAFNEAKTFQSTLDSTSTLLVMDETSVYRTFNLYIKEPGFARMYMPLEKKAVRLVDEEWNDWQCGWNPAEDRISGNGWYHFALQHCLEKDDALILEILRENPAMLTLKVHIFRVVPILPRCSGWKRHICPPHCKAGELAPTSPIRPILSRGPMQPRSKTL